MKKLAIVAAALLTSKILYAAKPLEVDSLIQLQSVIISANKIEVNRNSVPLSISVIDREEIERTSESALLPVLSHRVPGLFVTQKGITGFGVSDGSAGTINIRGVGNGNKVLVLFDGQPQWAGLFGHSLPDTYVASDVDKVEVIRGPGSLLYGSNAMGGVINIITRRHREDGRRTQARVMYGSYNTQKYMVNNGYNVGNFSSFISINHDRTDGHRKDSKFYITNGFLNLGYRFNEHYKANANLSLAKSWNQNPGMIDNPIYDNTMDILRGTTSVAFENSFDKTSGAIRIFYNWGHHEINDGYYVGESPQEYLFFSDDHNVGAMMYQSFRLFQGNSFTIGIDYKNWGGKAKKGEPMVDESVNETAGYVIMQQDLWNFLSINAGIRYEHNSSFGGEWIPQGGLTVRPFEGNVIKASISKGFRSPNIREMYMFTPQNPDLLPESMINYEFSIGQHLFDGNLFTEATLFYIDGKNMIQTVSQEGRLPMNMNTGAFTNKGVEFELRYQILKNLSFDTNYSYLHQSNPINGAPTHKLYAGVSYSPKQFSFDVYTQSIWGLYTDADCTKEENYAVLNARAAYRFGTQNKGLTLFVKGENLTASRYEINEGFPMPKATFMGGIDFTF